MLGEEMKDKRGLHKLRSRFFQHRKQRWWGDLCADKSKIKNWNIPILGENHRSFERSIPRYKIGKVRCFRCQFIWTMFSYLKQNRQKQMKSKIFYHFQHKSVPTKYTFGGVSNDFDFCGVYSAGSIFNNNSNKIHTSSSLPTDLRQVQ
jgi:hypothetical protein